MWGHGHKTIFEDVFILPSLTRNGPFQGRSTTDRPLTNQKLTTAPFRAA
jgi:hypothetical protein